ncbi:MAG: thioredoxin family protein [Acidobacteriaceae bacterium]
MKKILVLLAVISLTPLTALAQAAHIYPDVSSAKTDIAKALVQAKQEHKRVILDFGGDWCPDCQVLNIYYHKPENQKLLDENYVLVFVNIGHMDANTDIAAKYGVPIAKGVPALAVLKANGTVLYSQKQGQFNKMRHMEESSVTDFLKEWKPVK